VAAGEALLPKTNAEAANCERELWDSFKQLPCLLTLELPVPRFTVRQVLELKPGVVVDTGWSQATDMPLRVNGELLAWSEFEIVDDGYGVRITELT
jgi:flagellar motor switch/type III secretory pathway protein FliN